MERRAGRGGSGGYASRLESEGDGPRDAYRGLAARVHADAPVGGVRLRASGSPRGRRRRCRSTTGSDTTDFLTHQVLDPNTEETDRVLAGRVSATRAVTRRLVEGELAFSGSIDYENRPDSAGGDFVDTRLDNARDRRAPDPSGRIERRAARGSRVPRRERHARG